MKKAQFFSRLSLVLALLFCFTGFTTGQVAFASKALPPQVKILLGFKERYGADNKLHYGIDVYAEKGTELYAPAEGTISFVGRVPGSAGLNVTALTITTEAGHQISINPFATTTAKKGDVVEKGQALGTVSDVGDPSSVESHFHLSLREKGVYKDPTHLLMETISTVGESEGAGDNTVAATTPPASKPPANSSTAPAQSPAAQPQPQPKTQSQKTETKAGKAGAQSVTKPVADSNKSAAEGKEKSPKTAPATSTQTASQKELSKTQSAGSDSKNLAATSPSSPLRSFDSKESAGALSDSNNSNEIVGAGEDAEAANSALQQEPSFKSESTHFEGGQIAALNTSAQDTILQFGQTGNTSLRAEILAHLSKMNQAQLAATLFAFAMFISCAGLGAWKVVQLTGLDSALRDIRRSCALALKGESEKS